MDGLAENPRPTKRARLFEPDGFASAKRSTKLFPVHEFISSFDEPSDTKEKPKSNDNSLRSKASVAQLKGLSSKLPKPVHPHKPAEGSKPQMRVLKPPPNPLTDSPRRTPLNNVQKVMSLASLRPQMIPGSSKGSLATSGKQLTRLIPPLPAPATPKANKILKPMKPPAFPLNPRQKPDRSKMKTISTTSVAISTNPFTEQGSLNLLAMISKDVAAAYMPPKEREMRRGLLQSPEKRGRHKKERYIPGGLADNAKAILSQSQTALALWEKEIRSHSKRGLAPEVCLRILSIIYTTPPHTPPNQLASRPPVVAVARAKVEVSKVSKVIRGGDLFVMFRLDPPTDDPPRTLKENMVVWMWRPWFIVPLPTNIEGISTALGGKKLLMCNRFYIPT